MRHPRSFDVEQLVAPGRSRGRAPLLPSLRYHPARRRTGAGRPATAVGSTRPRRSQPVVIGRARAHAGRAGAGPAGGEREELAVACGGGSPGADPALGRRRTMSPKVSPVDGQRELSRARARGVEPRASRTRRSEQQDVVLTVPASFDEGARALTLRSGAAWRACRALRLLEEPQAAFYDWLFRHRDTLDDELRADARWCWCATSAAARPTSP